MWRCATFFGAPAELFALWTLIALNIQQSEQCQIPTSSGKIIGHQASSRLAVMEFLGIPFARTPTGELRFAPPAAFEDEGVINATTFVRSFKHHPGTWSCPYVASNATIAYPNKTTNFDRIVGKFLGQGGVIGEDCLTLNIWSKHATSSLRSTDPGKAVMVFFYGGRFAIGGTNNSFYNGQYLADSEDVVVVTINYRTNIFGFPGAPGEIQNVGLLDQRLALEWVRTNIAEFTGDPARITIFGQSAGGVSVDYHSFAFADDPIAAGLISHSGTALSFIPNTAELVARYWRNATVAVGCANGNGDESDEEIMQCMRGKNFSDILAAGAQPTVDNITVFANYAALSNAGKFAKLPYLLGSLDNEAGFYRIRGFTAGLNLTDSQWSIFNSEAFTCATSQTASFRVRAEVPIWRYRYFGDWNNLRLYNCCPGSGAYHGSDLEMVFGTAEDVSGIANGIREERVSKTMRRAWGAFAKDPRAGLNGLGWPEYGSHTSRDTLVRLAFEDDEDVSFINPDVYDAPCAALGGSVASAQGAF
ncbi:carboxylesterase [Mycena metata]|uniref:Carboxylesterase n=1 Tax=Mycena metata TaxID=1033252 RepID=A0AAD7HU74_9AGAR|nr:carboxylesterase [Mycena metata]